MQFLKQKSYWLGKSANDVSLEEYDLGENLMSESFEEDPMNLKATVKLSNLTKKFHVNFEEKTVVNNISIKFYENQITGFLGNII